MRKIRLFLALSASVFAAGINITGGSLAWSSNGSGTYFFTGPTGDQVFGTFVPGENPAGPWQTGQDLPLGRFTATNLNAVISGVAYASPVPGNLPLGSTISFGVIGPVIVSGPGSQTGQALVQVVVNGYLPPVDANDNRPVDVSTSFVLLGSYSFTPAAFATSNGTTTFSIPEVTFVFGDVPEPSSIWMAGSGLAAMTVFAARRNRRRNR